MSRIADAYARSGKRLLGEDAQRWETEQAAAIAYLGEKSVKSQKTTRTAQLPTPSGITTPAPEEHDLPLQPAKPMSGSVLGLGDTEPRSRRKSAGGEAIDFELTAAMRRIFLSPKSTALGGTALGGTALGNTALRGSARSVLFCTVPGDRMSAVAWRAAEVVATQSGKRVAFVEDGTNEHVRSSGTGGLVTRVGWYAGDTTAAKVAGPKNSAERVGETTLPVLGEHVTDLFRSFDFVIVSATAPSAEDLAPLAREVDGVIVVVAENETPVGSAETLVESLRGQGARLLGAVFVQPL